MKLLEVDDLPYCVKRAIEAQAEVYSDSVSEHLKGVGQFDIQLSVTTLNKSPRQNHLYRRHSSEMVVNPWDRIHLLDGSIFHYILECHKQPGALVEERVGVMMKWNGKRIYLHGAADLFIPQERHLIDFKRSSTISMNYSNRDYEFQLNVLRWILLQQKGHTYEINKISNFYSFKDWNKTKAVKNKEYPQRPMLYKDHRIWTEEELRKELFDRIKLHVSAEPLPDNDLPFCTEEQKWQRNQFRVIPKKKDGEWSGSSKGTFPTYSEAETKGKEIGEHKIEEILGTPRKCIEYCDCAIFCNQRQQEIQQNQQNEDEYEM